MDEQTKLDTPLTNEICQILKSLFLSSLNNNAVAFDIIFVHVDDLLILWNLMNSTNPFPFVKQSLQVTYSFKFNLIF